MKNEHEPSLAALLVDLENLYLAMADEYVNPADLTITALQTLREHLVEERGLSPVVGRAYAPFDYSTSRVFVNDLALMGITPVHVLAHASKNSADLMLAIDAMELLFRRADIRTFVIVGGDRDYIPVVERIKQNAKGILVVSPRHAMSGDLVTIVGKEGFLDPLDLLPEGRANRKPKEPDKARPQPPGAPQSPAPGEASSRAQSGRARAVEAPGDAEERDATAEEAPSPQKPTPASMAELEAMVEDSFELDDLRKCVRVILTFQAEMKVREVWLGPFLRVMNDAFPLKNNAERKNLLNRLDELGAVEIAERRRNEEGGTYAVLLVNWTHPLVIEANPG